MAEELGARLKARREALGQSVEQVAVATRIPPAHLRAIEEGRLSDLPAGPWASAYTRALCDHLGIDLLPAPPPEPASPPPPPPSLPLWAVRVAATGSILALAAVIGWQLWVQFGPPPADPAGPTVQAPDQVVRIVARRSTNLRVHVDEVLVFDRAIPGGEVLTFSGHDRVEIEIPAVAAARFEYNGQTVVPQGRQEHPRRLVFIDDVGPAVRAPTPPAEGAP